MRGILLLLALASAASAQPSPLPIEGQVRSVGDPLVVTATGVIEAPLGARLYTYNLTALGNRQVGRLTGVYLVIGRTNNGEGISVRAVRDPDADPRLPGAQINDAIEIDQGNESAIIQLVSVPEGARVVWKGQLVGTTPLDIEALPGDHDFVLSAPGMRDTPTTISIPAGSIQEFTAILDDVPDCSDLFNAAEGAFARLDLDRSNQAYTEILSFCTLSPSQNQDVLVIRDRVVPELRDILGRAGGSTADLRGVAYALRDLRLAEARGDTAEVENQRRILAGSGSTDPYILQIVAQ